MNEKPTFARAGLDFVPPALVHYLRSFLGYDMDDAFETGYLPRFVEFFRRRPLSPSLAAPSPPRGRLRKLMRLFHHRPVQSQAAS